MSDRLLRELGDLARSETKAEEARFDERWDRLAAGTLTAEEEADLKALAESSPEIREAYQAFRPLGPDFQARVVSKIKRRHILPFRQVFQRVEVWVGSAAAVAAGVFFMWTHSPVPEITFAGLSVHSEVRGSEQPLTPGSHLTLKFRPDTDVKVWGLTARAFLSQVGSKDLRRWQPEPDITIDNKGFVILRGALGKDIQPGSWTTWIVVGRKGKLPDAETLEAELHAGTARHDDWKAVHADIEVRPPPR